jgi:hemerythrin
MNMEKIRVANGITWVAIPEADLFVLCGCPADSVKHLMKRGLIVEKEKDGVTFETGPNAILLSETASQKGVFSNLGEFPVLQMLYRQGMILPNHPNNTGRKPMLIGLEDQVLSQSLYIYRGTYGLTSEEEMMAAGASQKDSREMMRVKKWFAFDDIRATEDLLDLRVVDKPAVELRDGVFIRRRGFNQYEFLHAGHSVRVDLNLADDEEYGPSYTLGFHRIHREYFSIVHIGEGDGWNPDQPCMGSMIVFQGRIFLVDAGPNITHALTALGIGINEIEGVFQTHGHDDHFAGLTSLIRSDHRIQYYATALVRSSVVKKYMALTGGDESDFSRYFEVHDLAFDTWNSIEGLEVMPQYSLHPVETSVLFFRALWEGGYKTYAHLADIVSSETLKRMLTDDPKKSGIGRRLAEAYEAALSRPVDLKKIDVGGGTIHGSARDFNKDESHRIILSHLSRPLSEAEKEIGSNASFGHDDVLIPAQSDYRMHAARRPLRVYFPGVPEFDISMLANCPRVEANPGSIILHSGDEGRDFLLILSGVVEYIDSKAGLRNQLSAGALMGEMAGASEKKPGGTFRAASHVTVLRIPREMYDDVVRRNALDETIRQVNENRRILQNSWLFGEMVSFPVQLGIAKLMERVTAKEGEAIWAGEKAELYLLAEGLVTIFSGSKPIENVMKGGFFGEEAVLRRSSGLFEARVTYNAVLFTIPGDALQNIPIVHWKLAETFERRLKSFRTEFAFEWREAYRVGIPGIDEQHQKLFSLIASLSQSLGASPENGALETRTGELIEAVGAHLGYEQALIRERNPAEYETQRRGHEAFLSQLEVIRKRIPQAREIAIREVVDTLKDWIIDHTLLEDLKYRHLLK